MTHRPPPYYYLSGRCLHGRSLEQSCTGCDYARGWIIRDGKWLPIPSTTIGVSTWGKGETSRNS